MKQPTMDVSSAERAYSRILEDIIEGNLRIGQIVQVNDLSEVLGMSKTPIREAILALEREEILRKRGKFFFVVYPDPEEINQMYELRTELEAFSSYLAALRITKSLKSNLTSIVKEMKRITFNNPRPFDLANINGKFHSLIGKAANNRYLEDDMKRIRTRLRVIRITLYTSYENRLRELEEHRVVGKAILDGDPSRARELMYVHETNVWTYVKENVIPRMLY